MKNRPNQNVFEHERILSPETRAQHLKQRGRVIWLTGLSGSGKSTLGFALETKLVERGRFAYVLDGDSLRSGISADLGFSQEDRRRNLERAAHVARLFAESGLIVICAFVSPLEAQREIVSQIVSPFAFDLVYVSTSLATCEARDPKGLYQKARRGEISDFTGVSSAFEVPASPSVVISGVDSVQESVAYIEACLGL